MNAPAPHRLRLDGKEYGPFTRTQLRRYLEGRTFSDDLSTHAVYDPERGEWLAIASWLAATAESAPDIWQHLAPGHTYRRISYAGLALVLFWALVILGMRVVNGRWPGQGVTAPHRSHAVEPADSGAPAR